MKLKTMGRISGAITAAAAGYGGYHMYRIVSGTEYKKAYDFLLSDQPLENKAMAGLYLATSSALVLCLPPLALLAADGVTDIAKGTHHYLGMRLWQRFTKSEERKRQIDDAMKDMSESFEKPIRLRKKR